MGQVILITGLPRSGTSLVAGTFRACGAFTGETTGPSRENAKGNVENTAIREGMLKPYLREVPACELGLRSLPVINHKPMVTGRYWREKFMRQMRAEGYADDRPIVYKDAKIALVWQLWADAFPDAAWIIVRRPILDVVASVAHAKPMRRHFPYVSNVYEWARMYELHVNSIRAPNLSTVTPTADLSRLMEPCGLRWDAEAVADWRDKGLWSHGAW